MNYIKNITSSYIIIFAFAFFHSYHVLGENIYKSLLISVIGTFMFHILSKYLMKKFTPKSNNELHIIDKQYKVISKKQKLFLSIIFAIAVFFIFFMLPAIRQPLMQ